MLVLLLAACKPGGEKKADTPDDKPVITVSIEPLRYFTEAIAGDRFDVVSMVPKRPHARPADVALAEYGLPAHRLHRL